MSITAKVFAATADVTITLVRHRHGAWKGDRVADGDKLRNLTDYGYRAGAYPKDAEIPALESAARQAGYVLEFRE